MRVIAVLTSDWHLSSKPPVARSVEGDWFESMQRPLQEILELKTKYRCPIICAGDIFHHWNSSAELINWAMANIPDVFAIPGQHDLPLHNYKDIHKSAYWTLVKAQKIGHINPILSLSLPGLVLHGFPWGFKLQQREQGPKDKGIYLAVVHKYIWNAGAKHGGNPDQSDHARNFAMSIKGFDVAVVGDNHIGFHYNGSGVEVFNCGSLMCRNSDQRNYEPRVGLLYENGSTKDHFLDTSKDKWLDEKELKYIKKKVNLKGLLKEFKKISTGTINFLEVLERALRSSEISEDAKSELKEILESVK